MEIKARLKKLCTQTEKNDFFSEQIANGYVVEEQQDYYVALGYTEEEIAQQEFERERERKSKLKMTKQDFFLYVLKPYNITYSALMTLLSQPSFDTLLACYQGCNHIYRYDHNFMGNIKAMLEILTGQTIDEDELNAKLDKIFEEHTSKE